MKKNETHYILTVETSPEYARNTYYKAWHQFEVEIPFVDVPHDLRVWLVDHINAVGTLHANTCTSQEAVEFIAAQKLRLEKRNAELRHAIENAKIDELISESPTIPGLRYSLSRYIHINPDKKRTINWSAVPEKIKTRVHNRIAELNTHDIEVERKKEFDQLEKERLESANRQNMIKKAIEKSNPADLDRFNDGFMSEADELAYLKDFIIPIPDNFIELNSIDTEKNCNCGSETSDLHENHELNIEQYAKYRELKRIFPNAKIIAKSSVLECEHCGTFENFNFFSITITADNVSVYRYLQ